MRSTVLGLEESIKRAARGESCDDDSGLSGCIKRAARSNNQYQNDKEVTELLRDILKVEKKINKRLAHIEKLLRKNNNQKYSEEDLRNSIRKLEIKLEENNPLIRR